MKTANKQLSAGLSALALLAFSSGCATKSAPSDTVGHAANMSVVDQYTLAGDKHLVRDYPPVDAAGNINVLVEIPTGTNAKWEADKDSGELAWEFKDGKPREVAYLGYPGNYGMIPQTLLPKELGGDGDPLNVLVLGPAIPRGSIVPVRAIGVLKLLDGGEQDDKIIAVSSDSDLNRISSIEELQREFNGIREIVEIWFSNYKGPGEIVSKGYADVAESQAVINAYIEAYRSNVQ